MRGLVVEDERKVADFVALGLQSEGFAIDVAHDGNSAWDFASRVKYNFIIIDLMLPGLSGTQLLDKMRRHGIHTPVLVLTARDAIEEKVRHLQAGADDYMTKPFAFVELAARVRALIRRGSPLRPRLLNVADLELDMGARLVRRAGTTIDLTYKEYSLLEYLMLNAGQVVSRTMILEHVWDQSFDGLTNVVDVFVRHLRTKIDDPFPTKLIRTVRRVGYRLDNTAS